MFISNMTLPQYDCMVSPTLIVTVVGAEIGLLTPPLGLSCFAIKTTLDDPTITFTDNFSGAFPFAVRSEERHGGEECGSRRAPTH